MAKRKKNRHDNHRSDPSTNTETSETENPAGRSMPHSSGKSSDQALKVQAGQERSAWRLNLGDLIGVGVTVAWIGIAWLVFLGWRPDRLIVQHDGLFMELPHLLDLKRQGGDLLGMLYRSELQGGAKIYGPSGMMVGHHLFAKMGLGAVSISNFSIFLIQFLVAFLGVRATIDFCYIWVSRKVGRSLRLWVALTPLFAFLPVLGWRLTHGHESMICGSLFFLAVFGNLLALGAQSVTALHFALSVLAGVHAFTNSGQQMVVYSAVFGLPILMAIWWKGIWCSELPEVRSRRLLYTLAPFGILFVCLGIGIQSFYAMVEHVSSTDSPREFGKQSLTYSYITANLTDWISSLPWTKAWVSWARAEPILHHEINYAFGPLMMAWLVLPWRRWGAIGAGFLVSVTVAILFSMNVEFISLPLTTLIPPLNLFRVPERAVIPFVMVFPVLAIGALFYRWKEKFGIEIETPQGRSAKAGEAAKHASKSTPSQGVLIFLGAGAVGLLAWPLEAVGAELLAWVIFLSLMYFLKARPAVLRSVGVEVGLGLVLALGLLEVHAFQERVLGYTAEKSLEQDPAQIRDQILQAQPELGSPLVRAAVTFNLGGFHVNTPYALGIGSLNAYWFPNRRYLKLLGALEGTEFPPASHYLDVTSFKGYPILRQLYHQKYDVRFVQNRMVVEKWASPSEMLGGAWFSGGFKRFSTFVELGSWLHAQGAGLGAQLKQALPWVAEDPVSQRENLAEGLINGCEGAQILALSGPQFGSTWNLKTHVPGNQACPLVLATNYSEVFKVQAKGAAAMPDWTPIKVVPVVGALLGAIIPAGTTEVVVKPVFVLPAGLRVFEVLAWVGFGLILVLLALGGRNRLNTLLTPK